MVEHLTHDPKIEGSNEVKAVFILILTIQSLTKQIESNSYLEQKLETEKPFIFFCKYSSTDWSRNVIFIVVRYFSKFRINLGTNIQKL